MFALRSIIPVTCHDDGLVGSWPSKPEHGRYCLFYEHVPLSGQCLVFGCCIPPFLFFPFFWLTGNMVGGISVSSSRRRKCWDLGCRGYAKRDEKTMTWRSFWCNVQIPRPANEKCVHLLLLLTTRRELSSRLESPVFGRVCHALPFLVASKFCLRARSTRLSPLWRL